MRMIATTSYTALKLSVPYGSKKKAGKPKVYMQGVSATVNSFLHILQTIYIHNVGTHTAVKCLEHGDNLGCTQSVCQKAALSRKKEGQRGKMAFDVGDLQTSAKRYHLL